MAHAPEFFTTAEAAELAEIPPRAIEKAIEEGIVKIRNAPAIAGSVKGHPSPGTRLCGLHSTFDNVTG